MWIHLKYRLQLSFRSFIVGRVERLETDIGLYGKRERIQSSGLLNLYAGFGKAAHRGEIHAVPVMSRCVIGRELNGASKLPLGPAPVPIVVKLHVSQRGMSLRIRTVDLYCLL